MVVPEGIGQEVVRGVIRGHHQRDAALRSGPQQPGNEHAIANVMDMEFVEEQHVDAVQQCIHRQLDGCSVAGLETMGSGVQPAEEIVEVDTPFPCVQPSVEAVHQPRFAAAHRSVEVQAPRRLAGKRTTTARQLGAEGRQPLGCLPLTGLKLKPCRPASCSIPASKARAVSRAERGTGLNRGVTTSLYA